MAMPYKPPSTIPAAYVPNKTEAEFLNELYGIKVGERLTYHRGPYCGGPLKRFVVYLTSKRLVVPLSKKHGAGDYEFMVQRL